MQFCSNSVYIPFRGNHLHGQTDPVHGGSELLSRRLSQCYLMLIIMVFNAFDTCTWCRKSCIFDVSDQFVSLASIPFRISKKRSSNPSGTYSDQGWAYQMKAYSRRLKEERIFQSMSRKGNCHDNSVMENFFGLLKQ